MKTKKLDQATLDKSEGYDFEIYTAEEGAFVDEEGRQFLPASFKIRGKGDSVYCRIVSENSTDWTLMDEQKTAMAFKLKKAIASYSQEYSTDQILHGYCTDIILDDFQAASRRRLIFCNTGASHVHEALAIFRSSTKNDEIENESYNLYIKNKETCILSATNLSGYSVRCLLDAD